ncbi:MAG: DUF951 domain-containing protein [Clostridia bacterium]|nr:DUF951 domain-containing protein [Clostridia bacterium]
MIKIQAGDILHLKKPHPCGSADFLVMRVGSVVRIVCRGCGRDMNVDRIKLEKSIKSITVSDQEQKTGKDQVE